MKPLHRLAKMIPQSVGIFIGTWKLKIGRWWWKKMALKWLSPFRGLAWKSSTRLATTVIKQKDKHANRCKCWMIEGKEKQIKWTAMLFHWDKCTVWAAVHAQIVRVTSSGPFFLIVDGKWRNGKCVFLTLVTRFLLRRWVYEGDLFRFINTLLVTDFLLFNHSLTSMKQTISMCAFNFTHPFFLSLICFFCVFFFNQLTPNKNVRVQIAHSQPDLHKLYVYTQSQSDRTCL